MFKMEWIVCHHSMYKFATFTAWGKWWLEKRTRDLTLKLVAYTLTWSFSHANHRSGHNYSPPIAVDMVTGRPQCYYYLGPTPWGLICAMVHSSCFTTLLERFCFHFLYFTNEPNHVKSFGYLVYSIVVVQVYQLHSLKVATGEKEPRPGAWTHSLHPNAELQPCKPPVWPRFFVPNRHIYMVMGGLQCCDHLEPMPWWSVWWYAQRAASMCMYMSPRARGGWWCTVPKLYTYITLTDNV